MFDTPFPNEHHFLATTFSFNDGEFLDVCVRTAILSNVAISIAAESS